MSQWVATCLKPLAFTGLGFFLLSTSAQAHLVTPLKLEMYLGETRKVTVADSGSCSAVVEGHVFDESVATLTDSSPQNENGDPEGVTVTLYVTANTEQPGVTEMEVNWTGVDAFYETTGPCTENSRTDGETTYVSIVVLDPKSDSISSSGRALQTVNTFTGEFTLQENYDLYLDGPLPIYFQRYYGSHFERGGITGDLGPNWLHNYNWRLYQGNDELVIVTPKAKVYRFDAAGEGQWTRSGGNGQRPLQILNSEAGFVVFDPIDARRYHFDSDNRLSHIADGRGNELELTYNDGSLYPQQAAGRLVSIYDSLGRGIRLNYELNEDGAVFDRISETEGLYYEVFREVHYEFGRNPQEPPPQYYSTQSVSSVQEPPAQSVVVALDTLSEVALPVEDYYYESYGYSQSSTPILYEYDDPIATGFTGLLAQKIPPERNFSFRRSYYGQSDGESLAGRLRKQWDERDDEFNITYSENALQTIVTGPDGNALTHNHSAQGVLQQQIDEAGVSHNLSADGNRRHTSITDGAGRTTVLVYSTVHGKLERVTDRNGATTNFTYTPRPGEFGEIYYDLTQIRFADGTTRQFGYDSAGNLTSTTNQAGATWTYTYNERGQRITATNPDNATTTFTYNEDGTLASRMDAAENQTQFNYDQHRRLSQVTWPDTSFQNFSYAPSDQLKSIGNGLGYAAHFQYDGNGNLTSLGGEESYVYFGYNGKDLLETISSGYSSYVMRSYNSRQDLVAINFDGVGERITTTESSVFDFTYDAAGRPLEAITPLDNRWHSAYDNLGNLVVATTPEGNTYQYGYDGLGQVISITNPENAITQFSYDVMGRVTAVTDPLGNRTEYTFDPLGKVADITVPGNITGSFKRDTQGRLTEIVDPSGNSWKRQYSPLGQLAMRKDPLGREETYAYDVMGRIGSVAYADGTTQTLTYEDRDLVKSRSFSDDQQITYQYNSVGLLESAEGLSLGYDTVGRITHSNGLYMYYHGNGSVAQIDFGIDQFVYYTYDADGELESITDWLDGVTTFTRNSDGQITQISFPNGVVETRTLNRNGEVIGLRYDHAGDVLAEIQYSRDASGQIVGQTQTHPLAFVPSDDVRSQTVDAAQQIVGNSYDARGRLLDDGRRQFVWDVASRVVQLESEQETVSYDYDAFGGVITRIEGEEFTQYRWNFGFEKLPAISRIDVNETDAQYFIHTPEGFLLYSINDKDERQFHHYDVQGNTILLTNDDGDITDSFQYSPFGEILARQGISETPFTFGGRYGVMQEGENLFRMYQRLYDAEAMRFISPDPVADRLHPHAINPYNYAALNPLMYQDPLGTGATNAGAAEPTFDVAAVATGAVGIRAAMIDRAAGGVERLVDVLGNALPPDSRPQDFTPASAAVGNARRLQGLATGLHAVDHSGSAIQAIAIGSAAYQLKSDTNAAELAFAKRLRLAFDDVVGDRQALWLGYESLEVPHDTYQELSRTRWLNRHHSQLQRIEQLDNGNLLKAGVANSWLNHMIGVQNLFEPDIPIPQQRWPQMLSPENNYPGVR